nr:MAG TPA: hypothetical protein [Caudoviricetes sp.]
MVDTSKLPISRVDELISKLDEINNRLINLENRKYIIETWNEGTEWYRVWSDGWIEQGGTTGLITSGDSYNSKTITFKKSFTNTNYTFTSCANKYSTENGLGTAYPPFIFTKNNTSIIIGKYSWTDGIDWYACGY